MKIKIYILIEHNTDDCSYYTYDFYDCYATRKEAEDKMNEILSNEFGCISEYSIREVVLENPEIVEG